jgi:hypothetical protein
LNSPAQWPCSPPPKPQEHQHYQFFPYGLISAFVKFEAPASHALFRADSDGRNRKGEHH